MCAIEHRDGSGPRSFVNHAKKGKGTMEDLNTVDDLDHSPEEAKHGYDIIVSRDNPLLVDLPNQSPPHLGLHIPKR